MQLHYAPTPPHARGHRGTSTYKSPKVLVTRVYKVVPCDSHHQYVLVQPLLSILHRNPKLTLFVVNCVISSIISLMKVGHMRIRKSSSDHFLGVVFNEETHGDLCFSPLCRHHPVNNLQDISSKSNRSQHAGSTRPGPVLLRYAASA